MREPSCAGRDIWRRVSYLPSSENCHIRCLERLGELLVLALEQHLDVARGFLIFLLRAQAFDARAEAAFQMIFEARPRQLAVDLDLARAKLKRPIDQIQRFSRERRRQERTVITRAVALRSFA